MELEQIKNEMIGSLSKCKTFEEMQKELKYYSEMEFLDGDKITYQYLER